MKLVFSLLSFSFLLCVCILLDKIDLVLASCADQANCGDCVQYTGEICHWCSLNRGCVSLSIQCSGPVVSNLSGCTCDDIWRQRACNNCVAARTDCFWCAETDAKGCYWTHGNNSGVQCNRMSSCSSTFWGLSDLQIAFLLVSTSLLGLALITTLLWWLFCRDDTGDSSAVEKRKECEEQEDLLSHLRHGTLRPPQGEPRAPSPRSFHGSIN